MSLLQCNLDLPPDEAYLRLTLISERLSMQESCVNCYVMRAPVFFSGSTLQGSAHPLSDDNSPQCVGQEVSLAHRKW